MYSIGIDVSKGKSMIAIITTDGEVIHKPFEIENNKTGFKILEEKIKDIPKDQIKFIMEATGAYHRPILKLILDNGYFACVENPLTVKKYCDVDIRKAKTDKKDALKIAAYGSDKWHKLRLFEPADEVYEELKFLARQYEEQTNSKTVHKIQLDNLIDVAFPGLKKIFNGDSLYLFMLDIFEIYYHPDLVLAKSKARFKADIEKIAKKTRHRVGSRIAEEMYSLANNCVPSRPCNELTQLAITSHILLLKNLEEVTKTIITKMDEIARTLPEFEVVSNMSGVGKKIRSRLIAEVGDINRFKSANSLIAYAGIDTPPYESGQFKATQRRISKRGNKHLRKVGYETMKSLKTVKPKNDNSVYLYILKKEEEGKLKTAAKIAGLNKFLRIYFARVSEVYQAL